MSALGDAAVNLAERGLYVFPIRPREKTPMCKGGFKDATTDVERIRTFWQKHSDANIGLYPGPSRLLIVDLDGPKGEATARQLGLLDLETLAVRTGRKEGGQHLYFVHPGGKIGNIKIGDGIDIRADSGYVLAPPSIHPSGTPYEWLGDFSAIRSLTDRERALFSTHSPREMAKTLTAGKKILEGSRNNSLTQYVGKQFARRLGDEEVLVLAHNFNSENCMPPLSVEEVNQVVHNISNAEQENQTGQDSIISELNEAYAFVIVGDKSAILEETLEPQKQLFLPDHGFRLLTIGAFKDKLKPQHVRVGKKFVAVADYWLAHQQRRQYDRIVFAPGQIIDGAYNLWRGFAVKPNPQGDCGLFLAHIRDNICQGCEALFLWVMGWFAQMFQQPSEKPGTSLVFRGSQGVGKSIVGKTIGFLLGAHYVAVAEARFITSRFNSHLVGVILLQAEEAFWAGDYDAEGKLKDLITGEFNLIEFKGREPIRVRNYVRLLVTSNADRIVPAGLEERRFAVLDVGTARMQDHVYFAAMEAQLQNGGYEALLHYLLTFDLGEVNLRKIPQTAALFEQKIASLSPKQAWLLDILSTGKLPGDLEGTGQSPTRSMFEHYIRHAQNVGARYRSIETELGIFLKKHIPGLKKYKRFYTDEHDIAHEGMVYQFPPLAQCRAAFGKAIRYLEAWEEPTSWLNSGL